MGESPLIDFTCNICGAGASSRLDELTREADTCPSCHSTVRYRTIVHLLSLALFGKSIPLPGFPADYSIRGLGTSEWDGFTHGLETKLDYRNTFLDVEPRLDLTKVKSGFREWCDFLICTEVLEHVAPPVQTAFDGLYSLLKPGGILIFSVPYQIGCETIEHFEDLKEWSLCEVDRGQVLVNRRADGRYEVFDELEFHGGRTPALEMRIFGKSNLEEHLTAAGFDFQIIEEDCLEFGIHWAVPWSRPILARKKAWLLNRPLPASASA